MCVRILKQPLLALAVAFFLPLSATRAQEAPTPAASFEIEPPLLVRPGDVESSPNEENKAPPDVATLERQLERAKKSAAAAERLVRMGVLAKAEAEQRGLRVVRLEAELAKAQLIAAQEQEAALKAQSNAGQGSQADLEAARATLDRASAAAGVAEDNYHKALLNAAALNLRRQRQLLSLGSAHKSDVARAEEKLATLQRGEQGAP